MYPFLISEFVELCCVTLCWKRAIFSMQRRHWWHCESRGNQQLIFYGVSNTRGHDLEPARPCMFMKFCHTKFLLACLAQQAVLFDERQGQSFAKRRVNPCRFCVRLHNRLALTGLLRCINLSLPLSSTFTTEVNYHDPNLDQPVSSITIWWGSYWVLSVQSTYQSLHTQGYSDPW